MKKTILQRENNRETGAAAVAPAFGRSGTSGKELSARIIFLICALFSIVAVLMIVFYLLFVSIPAFREIGVFNFLFKKLWNSDRWADGGDPSEYFGILPEIVSSLVITLGAVLLGGLLGVCSAIFMVYYCPKKVKGLYTQLINLLAGIPSIVFGFVGLEVLARGFRELFDTPSGMGPLPAVIVLALMIMPTIASLSRNSLESVPKEYYEGSLAMGNTKAQAIFNVCVPAAKKGIVAALILGVGRAVGETMAVQMVVGNATNYFPTGPFQGVETLTTIIVNNMAYSYGLWREALLAVGFVLLCFVLIINVCLGLVQRERKTERGSLFHRKLQEQAERYAREHEFRAGGKVQEALRWVCISLAWFVIALLAGMVIFITVRGLPNLTFHFVFGEATNTLGTLRSAFISTILIILMTLLIALPLGIGAAIFLNEYSKKGSWYIKLIRLFVDTLSGIPSIVFGLFGMVFFTEILGRRCLLAGSFTMVLIILPTIIRSTEESLREVPDSMREASLALGASKVRTIFRIILPTALSGIVTSVILSVGRIIGESAALIYTAGASMLEPGGYLSPGVTFAVMMYVMSSSGVVDGYGQTSLEKTYATAFVLLVIVALLNVLVTVLEKKIKRKMLGDGGAEKRKKFRLRPSVAAEAGTEEAADGATKGEVSGSGIFADGKKGRQIV